MSVWPPEDEYNDEPLDVAAVVSTMIDRLALEPGMSITEVVDSVSAIYRKPIVLHAVSDTRLRQLTGLFRDTPSRGYVSFRLSDPLSYQLHCICHELGHAAFQHENCDVLRGTGIDLTDGGTLGERVIGARGRGLTRSVSERVAEEFAYRLMTHLLGSGRQTEEDVFG
ncbi:hypothetical protein RI685_16300 (plasmid) [Clavibacter michiganensis]|uniref:hypothetical protein n=1 Tax=Clavibacter michiganensis TaxID=28447 RepID=UPI003DA1393C